MTEADLEPLVDHYCQILARLFQPSGDPFDFVLAILRATGFERAGWDTLPESFQMLDDLETLAAAELPSEYFPKAEHTRLRLSLLEYCHLVEMDAPYDIIANLCHVRLGMRASTRPFSKQTHKVQHNVQPKKVTWPAKLLHPTQKIDVIKSLTKQAGLSAIGTAFDDFYRAGIRNAISHSDYIIHEDELRMRHQTIPADDRDQSRTSIVKLDRLHELINAARAFYRAFVRVEKGARLTIGQQSGRAFKYDGIYKGLLEFRVDDEGYLCGVVIHWPNGSESRYLRTTDGSTSLNVLPLDGRLEAFVGHKHSPHDPFSPLLAVGQPPTYTPLEGSSDPLQWHTSDN